MGSKIRPAAEQLSLATQIGPGTKNKKKLICCFALCSVTGLEHLTVSGFRIQCVLYMTRPSGSTEAVVVQQDGAHGWRRSICLSRATLKSEQKLLWGLHEGHIKYAQIFFFLKSGAKWSNYREHQSMNSITSRDRIYMIFRAIASYTEWILSLVHLSLSMSISISIHILHVKY